MPDPYASIAQADEALQTRLAGVLELRAADPQQRAMLNAYLSEIQLPSAAIVLDVGCGTGAVTRVLAQMRGVRAIQSCPSAPETVEPFRSRMRPLTSSCSTPLCAICQILRRPFMKRGESFALADGWPCLTGTI
jgi:SAM-dependent methyltransferase